MLDSLPGDMCTRGNVTREGKWVTDCKSIESENKNVERAIGTYCATPFTNFASNSMSFPSASLTPLKSNVASKVAIPIQRDASAACRPGNGNVQIIHGGEIPCLTCAFPPPEPKYKIGGVVVVQRSVRIQKPFRSECLWIRIAGFVARHRPMK